MCNAKVTNYATVITDGSDETKVEFLTALFRLCIGDDYGPVNCRALDEAHPTTMVLEGAAPEKDYELFKKDAEFMYPGLCIFNATV